jgi:hypothetical protein
MIHCWFFGAVDFWKMFSKKTVSSRIFQIDAFSKYCTKNASLPGIMTKNDNEKSISNLIKLHYFIVSKLNHSFKAKKKNIM